MRYVVTGKIEYTVVETAEVYQEVDAEDEQAAADRALALAAPVGAEDPVWCTDGSPNVVRA